MGLSQGLHEVLEGAVAPTAVRHRHEHALGALDDLQTAHDEAVVQRDAGEAAELLVVPQEGRLRFCTELGIIDLEQKEIAILPRGLVYRVELIDGPARGFVCENYGQKFELPDRGPIGANCLANPRDFKAPVAAFEDREVPSTITVKWCGQFHRTEIGQSPLDVVAWHGNYAPYKYDLRNYCPVGAILFDHPDPSIFTVLTAPSGTPGTAWVAE